MMFLSSSLSLSLSLSLSFFSFCIFYFSLLFFFISVFFPYFYLLSCTLLVCPRILINALFLSLFLSSLSPVSPSLSFPNEVHMRHTKLQEHYLASWVRRNHKSNLCRAVLRSSGAQTSFPTRTGFRGTGNNNRSRIDIIVEALRTANTSITSRS